MKILGSLLKKDIILGFKDVFILLEIAFAVLFAVIIGVFIPEDVRTEGAVYIYDPTKVVETFVLTNVPDADKRMGEYYVDSRDAVIEGMTEDESAVGLIITNMSNGRYGVELLVQPYTKPELIEFIDLDLEDLLAIIAPPHNYYSPDVYGAVEVKAMEYGQRDLLPFNQQLMPPVILLMVGILGLFAMVSQIGQERSEATMQAFRIAPPSTWLFITSKHLMILATGFVTFAILYIPVLGLGGFFESLLLIVLLIIFGSSLGVILGSFFENPMAAILWVMVLMMILGLPAISLYTPTFSPDWLKLIPSYHALFGLDAAMFPQDNSHLIWQGAGILAAIDVVMVALSGFVFTSVIRKEA